MGAHSKAPRLRRARSILTVAVLTAGGLVWAAQSSFAVHDTGQFELDGNVVRNAAAPPPYDWTDLFNSDGTRKITPDPINGPILASVFVDDTDAHDSTYFAGGTKIDDQIRNMACGGPAANDKTSMDYAYAAMVQIPAGAPDNGGDQVLYLGLEKQAAGNGGDNAFGFWLFKDKTVGCSGSGSFTGAHKDGDLFIDGLFTNGGGASDVEVFRWNGNDITGSLGAAPIATGDVCGVVANDQQCAIANGGVINSGPWRASSTMAANTFVEAGIDLTAILGSDGGCFSTFMADSQASQSTNSQPKDYVGGQLSTCVAPPITTNATPGGTVVPVGATNQHDVATITPVANHGTPSGTITFFLCNPSQVTAGGCVSGGTAVPSPVSPVTIAGGSAMSPNAPGALIATTGKYCWRAEYTPDDTAAKFYSAGSETNANTSGAGAECFVVVHASPTIATQSSADTDSNAATNSVGFTTLGDVATLSGVASGSDLSSEHVTFNLYRLDSAPGVNDCTDAARVYGPVNAPLTQVDATTWHASAPTFKPTAADGSGFYTWVASYGGDAFNDAIAGHCGDPNETQHLVGPLLTLTKGTPHSTITAGDNVVYDVNLGNVGSGSASGVVVTDVLPILAGGGTWTLTGTNGYNCTLAAGTGPNAGHQVLTCTVGQLDPSTLTQIAELTAPTTTADCGTISNTAVLTADPDVSQSAGPINVTVQCPSLTITKTADANSVTVGDPIGFTVVVTNNGQGTASGVDIEDPLPTGPHISWTVDAAHTSGPLTCGIANNTLSCTGSLASGASESVHITSPTAWNVDGNSCGTYNNTATVSADNAIIDNPQASDSEDVLCPDLHITKTADAAAVNAGTDIGFKIIATNTGTGTATGALINDPLPAGVTWSIDAAGTSGPLTCGIASGTLTCTGTLLAGATETVHITAHTAFADCGTYDNTATLTATNTPQAPSGEDSTDVLCANVVVHKDADHTDPVTVGSDIGFTVTVTNNGAGQALGVHVNDPLPAGQGVDWSIESSTGPLTCSIDGTAPNQTLKCDGDLAASGTTGDAESVHITSSTVWNADANSCGIYDNTANLQWDNGPDATISSNQATETVQCPDLTFVKTPDADSVSAGQSIGFTVTATNSDAAGTGVAESVAINDPLPGGPGINWSIESGPANCTVDTDAVTGAQTLACSAVDLGPGDRVSVHIVSGTTPQSCAVYDNTAQLTLVNAPAPDPAEASTEVLCPSLGISKIADAASVRAGHDIGFLLTVTNAGPGTALGAMLTDPLPSGKGVSWSIDDAATTAPGCSVDETPDGQVLTCALGDITADVSYTVHVVSGTTDVSCANYPNVATAGATNSAQLIANADTKVTNCLGTGGTTPPPPTTPPAHGTSGTGAPVKGELELVVVLLGAGLALLMMGRRRRSARHSA